MSNLKRCFYYNNGVKLLCRKITRKAAHSTDRITGLFALEGVSLVNGAQTTGSIGAVYADMPDVVARAKVFIQMIDLADTEEEQQPKSPDLQIPKTELTARILRHSIQSKSE